jgi:DNA-binding transcriptional ArsR family regulator
MPEREAMRGYKAGLFKALSHPGRIQILELLRGGELSVGELQSAIGGEASTVSQQLAVLRARDLVATRKAGTTIYYRLTDDATGRLLDVAREMFDAQVRRLREAAEEL